MTGDQSRALLDAALTHLRRYRSLLLESRSGAASEKEQEALAVQHVIRQIEAAVAGSGPDVSP